MIYFFKLSSFLSLFLYLGCVGSSSPTDLVNNILNPPTKGFDGCVSLQPLDSARVRIDYLIPAAATEFRLQRNGTTIFTEKNKTGPGSYVDVDLIEGLQLNYVCEAIIENKAQRGQKTLSGYTVGVNPPSFTGINTASLNGIDRSLVTWAPSGQSNPAVGYFKIFQEVGPTVTFTQHASTVELGSLNWTSEKLGDELSYSFAVRACTVQDLCDTNVSLRTISTSDAGAPKSGRITSIRPGADNSLVLTAPWSHLDGGIRFRRVYKQRSGTTLSSSITDYDLVRTVEIAANQRHLVPTEISVGGIQENTRYFFVVLDEDPSGNVSEPVFGATFQTTDLTPPAFPGLTSLFRGTPENTRLGFSFTAIGAEPADPAGAATYLLYLRSSLFPTPVSNACASIAGLTPVRTISAAPYSAGQLVTVDVSNQIAASERTYYSACLVARDSAGNTSPAGTHRTVLTRDLTPPSFGGIKSLNRQVRQNNQRLLVIDWDLSLSSDVKEYKVFIWKNSSTFSTASPTDRITRTIPGTSSIAEIGDEFALNSSDQVHAYVEACDDASTLSSVIPGAVDNCTSLGEASKKVLLLPDNIDPPRNFFGITNAETDLIDPGKLKVYWDTTTGSFDATYAGFRIYSIDPVTLATTEIGDCPCPASGCVKSCSVSGLNPRKTYFLKVEAYNRGGLLTSSPLSTSTGYRSARTLDDTKPNFESQLDLSQSGQRQAVTFLRATDDQYPIERSYTSNMLIPAYLASVFDTNLVYEIYKKIGSSFSDPTKPYLDGAAVKIGEITEAATTPSTGRISFLDETQIDGIKMYYTVCVRNSSYSVSAPEKNRTCDGAVKLVELPDITKPVMTFVSQTKTSDKLKTWQISVDVRDNTLRNDLLVNSLQIYRRESDVPGQAATENDIALTQSDNGGHNSYSMSLGASNQTAVNQNLRVTIGSLKGPPSVRKFVSYLITVTDTQGNKQTLDVMMTNVSDNILQASILGRNQFLAAGGETLVLKGSGFISAAESGYLSNGSTRVLVAGVECANVRVLNDEYLDCTTPAVTSGTGSLQVINPDGTSISITGVSFPVSAASSPTICDDTPISNRRPSSLTAEPASVDFPTGAIPTGLETSLGSLQIGHPGLPYILCNQADLIAARDYNLFANRHIYLELGNHIDLSTFPSNTTLGLLQGDNFTTLTSINENLFTAKLHGRGYSIRNLNLTLTEPHTTGLTGVYPTNGRRFGLFGAIIGKSVIRDIHFLAPTANLPVNPAANTFTVDFGFLTGGYTIAPLASGSGCPMANRNSCGGTIAFSFTTTAGASSVNKNGSMIFSNIHIVEGRVVVSNTSSATVGLGPLNIGGILGSPIIENLNSGLRLLASPPAIREYRPYSNDDVVVKFAPVLKNSSARIEVVPATGSFLPQNVRIGGLAGVFDGRAISNSATLRISSSNVTGVFPAATFGVGGLFGEYRGSTKNCLSGHEDSVTFNSIPYCGLRSNSITMAASLPGYTHIGGIIGRFMNTSSDPALGTGTRVNYVALSTGITKNRVTGAVSCHSFCGGLAGGQLRLGLHSKAWQNSGLPLFISENSFDLTMQALRDAGIMFSQIDGNYGVDAGSEANGATYYRIPLTRNTIDGTLSCIPLGQTTPCQRIGGIAGSYTRALPESTGMSVHLENNLVRSHIIFTRETSNTTDPSGIGGVIGSVSDVNHPSGQGNLLERIIFGGSFRYTTPSTGVQTLGYHWLFGSLSRTSIENVSGSRLFFSPETYDGVTNLYSDLQAQSTSIPTFSGVVASDFSGLDFTNVWGFDLSGRLILR